MTDAESRHLLEEAQAELKKKQHGTCPRLISTAIGEATAGAAEALLGAE